ncbi:MAG: DNA repair protein RecN [bacterium]|jgi:DNA repair protein RecN (Recombination protein N)
MLIELRVRDFAIIDDISVRLSPGMNVLTGETGAGKSIIVGALSFLLGGKFSDEVIRKGSDGCRVEARFRIPSAWRAEAPDGISASTAAADEVVLARELSREGRSRAWLDGKPITLARLRRLGDMLVDFHGQHEHQLLLQPRFHIDFLDGFGHLFPLRDKVARKRQDLLEALKRISDLEEEIANVTSREDFIRFEIDEIEKLHLKPNEDQSLEQEISLLEHAEKIIEAGEGAMDAIYDGDDAALKQISIAGGLLERIAGYSEDLGSLAESLREAHVIIKDVAESLRDSLSAVDLDPGRLEGLRDRRVAIDRIKRKHGRTIEAVLEHLARLRRGVDNRDELLLELGELKAGCEKVEADLAGLARDLSGKRRKAAKRFEKLIQLELSSLGIEGGEFRVMFEELEDGEEVRDADGDSFRVGAQGMDAAEFFVRTNRGEDLLPLTRIASGGEISRVMLSLKRILADIDQVDTMIFDEIDSGIGGDMARVVGAKLREVAGSRQVVCITHLPQIAAPADLHLAVDKATVAGRTVTRVELVEGEERVLELARMIGGGSAEESARLHAREILKGAEI